MNPTTRLLITILFIGTFITASNYQSLAETQGAGQANNVFARVNGEEIPLALFTSSVNLKVAEGKMFHSNRAPDSKRMTEIRKASADRLIKRAVILQEAEKVGALPSRESLEMRFKQELTRYGGSERLYSFLDNANIHRDSYRRLISDSFKVSYYINNHLTKGVEVEETECREYYEEFLERYCPPSKADIRIWKFNLKSDRESWPEIEKEIEKVVGDGHYEAFTNRLGKFRLNRAKDVSIERGPLITYTEKPDDAVWEAIEKIQPGLVTYLKRNEHYFYIIHVRSMEHFEQTPFEEVRPEIESRLAGENKTRMLNNKIDELLKAAKVKILVDLEAD